MFLSGFYIFQFLSADPDASPARGRHPTVRKMQVLRIIHAIRKESGPQIRFGPYRVSESSNMVNGPSLTSDTSMYAPNTPC